MPILGVVASGISGHLTPPSSFESIATLTPSGATNSVTFNSIPQTYKHLQIRSLARDNSGGNGGSDTQITFNGANGDGYTHWLTGNGTTASAASNSGTSGQPTITPNVTSAGTAQLANTFAATIFDFIDYASTTKNKTVRYFSGCDTDNYISNIVSLGSGVWFVTSAITSITITNSRSNGFSSGTSFALYGIKG